MRDSPRLVLELPPLPAVEVLLALIAVLLARMVWLLASLLAILRKASEETHTDLKATLRSGLSPKLPKEARVTERRLLTSAKMFEQCMLGDADVDVQKFMDACRWYGEQILTRMGPFTMITVREIHANMDKVKHTFQLDPEKHRSMRALLEAECSSNMHQPGGILADPSAAMGMLWARRGLMFWVCLFHKHMDNGEKRLAAGGQPQLSLHTTVLNAYEEALAPFNGWVSRNTFMLATRTFPEWRDIEATWASNHEDAIDDMSAWVRILEPLLSRMFAIIKALDLDDLRKC
ncbi:MAG: hypothetical protein SGPRY_004926, partial [Prymnesium sp.]